MGRIAEKLRGAFTRAGSKDRRIESFEVVVLRLSGMRGVSEYEIVALDGSAKLTECGVRFSGEKEERIPKRSVICPAEDVLGLLNRCRILSWDGFHGKHPRGVKDGKIFSFSATVNGGKTVRAAGSQDFPSHFSDFTDGLNAALSDAERRE